MSQQPKDEFEKRMHFSGFISTLTDAVTKMNPSTLVSSDAKKEIEAAELKNQLQQTYKGWLDMLMHFIQKADGLGTQYPIESVLGIEVAKSTNT